MDPFKDSWEIEDVEAVITRGIPEELLYVPIAVSLNPPDCEWAQKICIGLSNHPHFNDRDNAILGFGHLVRTCRKLDLERFLPIVSAALKHEHEYVPGQAEDGGRYQSLPENNGAKPMKPNNRVNKHGRRKTTLEQSAVT